jgi:hypothetical protein
VARHPVAAFLVMVFALTYGTALVPVLTQRAILPFGLTLWAPLISFFCSAGAFIVVAAMHGRAGVLIVVFTRCLLSGSHAHNPLM